MVLHQLVAYGLFILPVCIMWEKLVKTHYKPLWLRLPSRLPVGERNKWLVLAHDNTMHVLQYSPWVFGIP